LNQIVADLNALSIMQFGVLNTLAFHNDTVGAPQVLDEYSAVLDGTVFSRNATAGQVDLIGGVPTCDVLARA
jgi:hypothetical protein